MSEAIRNEATAGRIDVHSHLLPGLDDGCPSLLESLMCARVLVSEGYTHSFCTPHIWPDLGPPREPGPYKPDHIRRKTQELQAALDKEGVPLTLIPGGEINLRPETTLTRTEDLVTFGMARKFCLIDLWADRLPDFFEPSVMWLQQRGLTVVLAHPERMKAVQAEPTKLADYFKALGLLLQGNLQCLGDRPEEPTRRVAEQFLAEERYDMLGSDLHNLRGLPHRINGLRRAVAAVGEEAVWRLTAENPKQLLPAPSAAGDHLTPSPAG